MKRRIVHQALKLQFTAIANDSRKKHVDVEQILKETVAMLEKNHESSKV
jgi:hypothetical protein